MWKWVGVLCLALCTMQMHGQKTILRGAYRDTVWLINGSKVLESPFRKRRFEFALDARQTLIGQQAAKLGGFRLGMEYRRVHRFGVGVFALSEGVMLTQLNQIGPNVEKALLNLNYLSLYYERVLFFNRKWEWSATAHLGNGMIEGRYQLVNSDDWIAIPAIRVKPLEISSSVYYNINWWISIGAGGGYRYMRRAPQEAQDIYNAPITVFKLKIRFFKWIKGVVNPDIRDQY